MVGSIRPAPKKVVLNQPQQGGGVPAIAGNQTGVGLNGAPRITGTGGPVVQAAVTQAQRAGATTGVGTNPSAGNPGQGKSTVQPDPSTVGTSGTKNADGSYTVNQGADAGTTYDPNGKESIDSMVEDYVRAQIAGANNTTDQENLIKQLYGQQLGQQQVAARASMGRAGFGSSGALTALEGDQQRQAAQQAAEAIFGAKKDAAQQALAAAGLDIQEKNAANTEAENQARWAVLQKLLDGGGGDKPKTQTGDNGVAGDPTATQVAQGAVANSGLMPTDSSTLASAGSPKAPAQAPTKTTKDKLPSGSVPDGTEGNITYYKAPDGTEYYVVG